MSKDFFYSYERRLSSQKQFSLTEWFFFSGKLSGFLEYRYFRRFADKLRFFSLMAAYFFSSAEKRVNFGVRLQCQVQITKPKTKDYCALL